MKFSYTEEQIEELTPEYISTLDLLQLIELHVEFTSEAEYLRTLSVRSNALRRHIETQRTKWARIAGKLKVEIRRKTNGESDEYTKTKD